MTNGQSLGTFQKDALSEIREHWADKHCHLFGNGEIAMFKMCISIMSDCKSVARVIRNVTECVEMLSVLRPGVTQLNT
jgi:hypothetical protein